MFYGSRKARLLIPAILVCIFCFAALSGWIIPRQTAITHGQAPTTVTPKPSPSRNSLAGFEKPPASAPCEKGDPNKVAYQRFHVNGPQSTAWCVNFEYTEQKQGLYITGAYFTTDAKKSDKWVQVLGRAGVSEIFIRYNFGKGAKESNTNYWLYELNDEYHAAGDNRHLVGENYVVRELVRDGDTLFLHTDYDEDRRSARGIRLDYYHEKITRSEKIKLWSIIDSNNYDYIYEYSFHDDGTITFRVGATGINLEVRPDDPHIHDTRWRIDIDLGRPEKNNGPDGDSVFTYRHRQDPTLLALRLPREHATRRANFYNFFPISKGDHVQLFNGGKEGFADRNAEEFTALRVVDSDLVNGCKEQTAYDLISFFQGVARDPDYPELQHDFAVTRYHENELNIVKRNPF